MYPQQLQQVHPNLTIQWASNDHYFATRGYEIFFSGDEGKSWQSKGKIRRGILSSAAANPLIAQVGRLGIQSLLQLASKSILCIADGVLYRTDSIEYNFTSVFSEFTGRRSMRVGSSIFDNIFNNHEHNPRCHNEGIRGTCVVL